MPDCSGRPRCTPSMRHLAAVCSSPSLLFAVAEDIVRSATPILDAPTRSTSRPTPNGCAMRCLDVVSDGEMAKPSFITYAASRLSAGRRRRPRQLAIMAIAPVQDRSDVDDDVADQAVRAPIEIELAVELLADARHHPRAEAFARRRRHRRSTGFDPAHG